MDTHDTDKMPDKCNTKGSLSGVRKREWVFTWNNYTENDIKYILEQLQWTKLAMQEEIGTHTHTPHLQGLICFKNARKFEQVKKLLPTCHLEICKNRYASRNYVLKESTRKEKGRQWKIGFKELQSEDKYKKLTKFIELKCKDVPKSIEREKLKLWQKQLVEYLETESNDRKIKWVWDESGNTGKSFVCKWIEDNLKDVIVLNGSNKDIMFVISRWVIERKGERSPKAILFDIPRSKLNHVSYNAIESIKDGKIISSKYENINVRIKSPHVVVFANSEPDFMKLSEDRWDLVKL